MRRLAATLLLVVAVGLMAAPRAAASPSLLLPLRSSSPRGPAPSAVPCLPVICSSLSDLGGAAADTMAKAVFSVFAVFVSNGVDDVLQEVSSEMAQTSQVRFDKALFQQHAAALRSLAIVVLLPLMLIGLISAVIHRDVHQLLRAGGVYVPVAIGGGAAAILLTETALNVTDALTKAVTGDAAGNTAQAIADLRSAISGLASHGAPGLATVLPVIVFLLVLAGALVIWIELMLRTSAIYVVVLFLPLALSGLVWRGTVHWTRRMIEVLVALILSKFVIVVVIDLAAGMIVGGDGVTTVLQGATLLLLAACAPFALLRLIPMVEAGVIGHFEGMERRPIRGGARAATTVARAVVGGVEMAAASDAVSANGGDAHAALTQNATTGGELNNVSPPDEFVAAANRPRRSAELASPPPEEAGAA